VGKNFNCGDFILKMYHLPFGRKGELIFDVRLHSGILFQALEHREVSASPRSHRHSQGEITLCLSQGDFDCISSTRILPQDFAVQILFGRDPNDFPQNIEVVPRTSGTSLAMGDLANSVDEARQSVDDQVENSQQMHLPPAVSLSARTIRSEEHTSDTHKRVLIRYLGPKAVSFNMDPSSFSSSVRTAFGDAKLFRVDLIRKETSQEIGLFLLFHVHLVSSFDSKIWKVLPYKFLFRYVVPFEIRMKMIEMEAEENLMNTSLPLSFGDGQGMSFDEEYARWLQQMYDTEMMTEISEFDGGFCANNLVVTKIQPSDTYKSCKFMCVHEKAMTNILYTVYF
jgi:hypothetical protein